MILNTTEPKIVEIIKLPDFTDLCFFKNVDFLDLPKYYQDYALKLKIHLKCWKHYHYDLKVQDLKMGQVPCLPGWHVDKGPFREAEYALVTFGCSRTEFFTEQLELPEEYNMKVLCHKINQMALKPSFKLKDGQIIVYNNTNIHRGSEAEYTGKRLLIRVVGSNDWRS